ncbi:MAG: LptF/LptG family permease [Gemmatimonadales bacterium]
MRLLERYLLRQMVAPFFFALGALTSIMILNQVARRFGALVGKGLPWSVIGEVFGLSIPFILAVTLPMSVLMAVLYAFTHLGADNEITAMRASGISVGQLVAPVLVAGILMAGGTMVFNDQVLPRTNARLRNLMLNIGRKKPTFELREQVINDLGPAGVFLRASRIEPSSGRMRDVTIYDMGSTSGRQIIYADSGIMALMPNETDLSLRLFSGYIHQTKPAEPDVFQLTQFVQNDIRVRDITNRFEKDMVETVRGDREMSTCEMIRFIRGQEKELAQAEQERTMLLRKDLRLLLGLLPPPKPPPVGERPAGGYCDWFKKARLLLLPKTVEAQQPTQQPVRRDTAQGTRAGTLRDEKLRLLRESQGRFQLPDSARTRLQQEEENALFRGHRPAMQLSTWSQVQNTRSLVQDTRLSAGRYEIEVHKKWSISVACIVFVLVGIPMALRFPRGGVGLVLGGGLGVFAVYYVGLIAGEALGDRALVNPVWVMWFSNAVFALLGIIGLYRVSRDAGTARGGDAAELFDKLFGWWRRWRAR